MGSSLLEANSIRFYYFNFFLLYFYLSGDVFLFQGGMQFGCGSILIGLTSKDLEVCLWSCFLTIEVRWNLQALEKPACRSPLLHERIEIGKGP